MRQKSEIKFWQGRETGGRRIAPPAWCLVQQEWESMATQKIMGAREWALLLILSVLWGGSFLFIGVAVKELPPLTIMMLRVSFAAVILHVMVRLMGQWMPRDPKVWLAFAGMGLLNNAIPQTLIVWGQ